MPVNPGFVTWCSSCNWNVNPDQVHVKETLIERLNRRIGEKAMKSVQDEVMYQEEMKHPWTMSKLAAYGLATLIHSLALVCFYQAIMSLLFPRTLGGFVIGMVCAYISYYLFPKFGRLPKRLLERNQYPAIHRLMELITEKMQTKPMDLIAESRDYNAYFSEAALFRKKVVAIGMPLFSVLSTQEKIAILAHEAAHSANRDITRRWYVGWAMNSLAAWYDMIVPSPYDSIFGRLVWLRMKLAGVIFWLFYLLGISVWRESQRAEYYADRLAGTIAGTDAAVSALEKLNYASTYYITVERIAQYRYSKDLFDEFRKMTANVPDREKLRLDRILEIYSARLDATHPPTRYRIEHLRNHRTYAPEVQLDRAFVQELEEEFARAERAMQNGILDDYRSWFLEGA